MPEEAHAATKDAWAERAAAIRRVWPTHNQRSVEIFPLWAYGGDRGHVIVDFDKGKAYLVSLDHPIPFDGDEAGLESEVE